MTMRWWTPEDVETLKRMWMEGKSKLEIKIAIEHRHGLASIGGKAHALKLPRRIGPHWNVNVNRYRPKINAN